MPNKNTERKFTVTRTDCKKALEGDPETLLYIQQVFGYSLALTKDSHILKFLNTRANQFDPRLRIASFDKSGLWAEALHEYCNSFTSEQYNKKSQDQLRRKIRTIYEFCNFICGFLPKDLYNNFLIDEELANAFFDWAFPTICTAFGKSSYSTLLNELFLKDTSLYFYAKDAGVSVDTVRTSLDESVEFLKHLEDPQFKYVIQILCGENLPMVGFSSLPSNFTTKYWPAFAGKGKRFDFFSLVTHRFDYIEDYKKYLLDGDSNG